jgi:hypothetical protein
MITKGESFIYMKEEDEEVALNGKDEMNNEKGVENKKENFNVDDKNSLCNNNPIITSLDKLPKYTNFFISVHPFIFHGYRIHHSIKHCVFSIFTLHNETLNIWTHLIPFITFLIVFTFDATSNYF